MIKEKLRVGVIGAGRWSNSAHLPGFTRSPLCEVVMVCDLHQDLADAAAKKFDSDWMLPSCPSSRTVSKYGSGFQIPGLPRCCRTGAHDIAASLSQSGSVPLNT